MKCFIFAIIISLGCGFCCGAAELDETIKSKLNTFSNIKGEFTQTKTLSDIDIELNSSGKFIFNKEKGLLWQTVEPIKSTMVYEQIKNEMCVIFDENDTKTIEKQKMQNEELSSDIRDILNGNIEKLKKMFLLSYSEEKNNWRLEMIPKDEIISSFANNITITGIGNNVKNFVMLVQNDDKISIKFQNIKGLKPSDIKKIKCNK